MINKNVDVHARETKKIDNTYVTRKHRINCYLCVCVCVLSSVSNFKKNQKTK